MRILDIGCGTGDLSLLAVKRLKGHGEIVGLDFSEKMLEIAEKRYQNLSLSSGKAVLRFVCRRAEELPFEQKPYDLAVSAFVLRNLYENMDAILSGVFEALRPGAQIAFLDFTEPPGRLRLWLWRMYMQTAAAVYGNLLFGKDYPKNYMTESAQRFLKAPAFAEKLREIGFENVTAQKFMMGIIVLYRAAKPLSTGKG